MSWENLIATLKEQRNNESQELIGAPVTCPFDGERLDINASGVRNCPFGNYRWNGGAKVRPINK
jgi:hypothetical protein